MHLPSSSWVPQPKPWFRDLSLEAGALQRFASQQVRQIRTWIEVLPIGSSTRYWAGLIGFRAFVWHTELSFRPIGFMRWTELDGLPDRKPVRLVSPEASFSNQNHAE